jgi:hypothetical protein
MERGGWVREGGEKLLGPYVVFPALLLFDFVFKKICR